MIEFGKSKDPRRERAARFAAAGSLLVAEVGGVVANIDGSPWTVTSDAFVATATRALHDDLLVLTGENA